ncbi:hypothetical protein [Trichocoleus sp. FACHB-262]|uniref:hypothetical protein n=1 Tax=Trichocoleus sp. FACHB-262 TaxID=2692869 RepID=UPI00168452BF|nr:hypothetical protein [Trichocoleus sp. FACHB-262]MBD2123267.1 hypothetical protein [Trichocoleus sp. FACHB-262]
MPQPSLFGASQELRQPQPPSNPKFALKQSQSPQPQAQRIASHVIYQVAIQSAPETAKAAILLDPDGTCLKYHKPISITALEVNHCSAACGWVVVPTSFKALSQSQGGGQ